MAASEPRRHHIVPAFYLAGFTATDSRTGRLHVFDYASGERYPSTPRKACRETDFYRIEEEGADPNVIEKLMSWHEGVTAPHVKQVGTGRVTNKREVGETLALAALQAVRSRRGRSQLQTAIAQRLGMQLRRGEVTREQREHLRASEMRNGATTQEVPGFNEAKERLLSGEWFPRAPAVLVVGLIPEAQGGLMKTLHDRHWEVHVTDSAENGGFICSDSPLVWGDLEMAMAGHQQSVTDASVEITFPGSRNVALVSYTGARDSTCTATDDIVAHVNARTVRLSTGLMFHAYDDFMLHRGDQRAMRRGSEFFDYVAYARRRGLLEP